MAKKKPKKNKKSTTPQGRSSVPKWVLNYRVCAALLFVFSFLLYANTLMHDFAQDDAIVITDNMFTQDGINGIPGILGKDTFFGFFKEEGKAQLVSGGRYRPFTLIMFAIEREIFGEGPFIGHFFNLIYYGLCVVLMYFILLTVLNRYDKPTTALMALLVSALFAAHPIHTEAVANIKGRDEIMSLLFSMLALWAVVRYVDRQSLVHMLMAVVSLFLGLMSKENAITFVVIIPMTIYFFRHVKMSKLFVIGGWLVLPTALFLIIRTSVLGQLMSGSPPMELMNNPFLKLVDGRYMPLSFSEKYATITYTLGKYIQLLFWPHPLTHDYYPRQIPIMSWGHPGVLATIGIYGLGLFYALKGWKKKTVFSYSFLYFVLTLSIVSNIVFPVGTNMSERFLFMPSLGFALWTGYWMVSQMWRRDMRALFVGLGAIILLGYSIKTIDRNRVWKNNATLFLTDIEVSDRSAKLQNAAGGEKTRLSTMEDDPVKKEQLLNEAVDHLQQAIAIHPTYKNAYLIMGNAKLYLKDYEAAIEAYQKALKLDPNYKDALNNIAIAYRDAGRHFGENEGNLIKAIQYLEEALRYQPEDYEANRLMGVAKGISGEHLEAVKYFEKAVEALPQNAEAWLNLANARQTAGLIEQANAAYERALAIDPDVLNRNRRGAE